MRSTDCVCLLIDDDNDDHEFFQEAADALDCNVELFHAKSGAEALSLLAKAETLPDFIFLDLNMPAMNGQQCLLKIKADPRLAKIPVVMYSTSSSDSDIKAARTNGAADYVIKPSSMKTLTNILGKFFNRTASSSR
jgi:CheY-like chemotaxis protein